MGITLEHLREASCTGSGVLQERDAPLLTDLLDRSHRRSQAVQVGDEDGAGVFVDQPPDLLGIDVAGLPLDVSEDRANPVCLINPGDENETCKIIALRCLEQICHKRTFGLHS